MPGIRTALRGLAGATLLLWVCLAATGARAQQASPDPAAGAPADQITAVPNRPTFSTTAETVQRGVLEVELGFEAGDGLQDLNGLLKFGLSKNLELRFANDPVVRLNGFTAFGDASAGFKYRVFSQGHARPTFSVLYAATFPTGGSQVSASAIGHSVTLLASKDFGRHHFDVNEGVQFFARTAPGERGFDHNYFSALAYSYQFTGKWGVTGEVAGFSRQDAATPASMTLMGAGTYNLSSRLVVDAGAYVAAFGQLPRVTFFSGVTYSVADLYHRHHGARRAQQ